MNIIKAQDYRLEAERLLSKDSSLDCIFPSLVRSRIKSAAELYSKAGNIYGGIRNWTQAKEYWYKSFELDYSLHIGINLGESYEKLNQPLEAINIYLEILDQENKISKPVYKILYKLGLNYMQVENWDKALEYFYTCIDSTDLSDLSTYKILSSILVQKIHIDLKDFEKASLIPFKTLSCEQNLNLDDDLISSQNLNTHILIGLLCLYTIKSSKIEESNISKLNSSVLDDFIRSPEYQIYLELIKCNLNEELIQKIKKLESSQTILYLINYQT